MGYLSDSYADLNPLKTDMYQLTMGQGYFDQGRHEEEASFYMHWRNPPFGGGYTVAAGLEGVVDFLDHFKFSEEHIAYLRTLEKNGQRLFTDDFLNYLRDMKLNLKVDAVPEGTIMVGQGPVIRVTGSLLQAQLVESAILNIVNSASIIATRASRIDEAAQGRGFADFSLRRAATLDASVARSSFLGGAAAVADVDAARRLGIPATGTMAHAWVTGFKAAVKGYAEAKTRGTPERWVSPYYQSPYRDEYEGYVRDAVDAVFPNVTNSEIELVAFKAYLRTYPHNSVLLIDSYEPVQGMKNAIRAALEMNVKLDGIRLDSGDLYALSWEGKKLLDEAKASRPDLFGATKIFATDGLDEKSIHAMQKKSLEETGQPLPIDVYGVGTELGNPGPLRGGVYKVCANEIIREDFETHVGEDGKAETIMVGGESIPVIRDSERTMKVAGADKADPSLPGPKSSVPGLALDTMRLKDAQGHIIADVIIDRSLCAPNATWQEMLHDGVMDIAGNPVDVAQVADAEMLLKPIFERANGESVYVYDQHGAPSKKPAYPGGPEVTDLGIIKARVREQRKLLPESITRLEAPVPQPKLLHTSVRDQIAGVMMGMNTLVPGTDITGTLTAQAQGTAQAVAMGRA